ncbi:MAG: type II toxin-antitoxin system PemK/MazF family toxin [Halothiobacillaceae bacterium]|nr:type II toxin-antitoxin system PemK/MazF family toxin [Halothiobacillaceae bacterium]
MLKHSDIVQIPFPFSDLTHQKLRPVMLLTAPDAFGDFIAVAITSQAGHDDAIPLQENDIANGRLPKISWVRAKKLFSLNRDSVVIVLGTLRPEAFVRIHGEICGMLGCEQNK